MARRKLLKVSVFISCGVSLWQINFLVTVSPLQRTIHLQSSENKLLASANEDVEIHIDDSYRSPSGDSKLLVNRIRIPPSPTSRVNFVLNVTYPSFNFNNYFFIDNTSKFIFESNKCQKKVIDKRNNKDRLVGHVVMIRDGVYPSRYDCGYRSTLNKVLSQKTPTEVIHEALAFPDVPSSSAFQEFLDGALPKVVQALEVLQSEPNLKLYLDRQPRDVIILDMLAKLGFTRDKIVIGGATSAKRLYYLCWTPPIHPALWLAGQRLLGVYDDQSVTQDLVILLMRNRGNSYNGGRLLLDEGIITTELRQRYGDKFVAFDSKKHQASSKAMNRTNLMNTITLFSRARVVLGVHGGALFNINFVRSGAHVVEIAPSVDDKRYEWLTCYPFAVSQMLGHFYWQVAVPAIQGTRGNVVLGKERLDRILTSIDRMDSGLVDRTNRLVVW